MVAGLGTDLLNQAMQASAQIYCLFDQMFAEGVLEKWCYDDVEGPVIEVSNCYFMPAKDVPGLGDLPFGDVVNYYGVLEGMKNHQGHRVYVYFEDNQVLYYKSYPQEVGKQQCVVFSDH